MKTTILILVSVAFALVGYVGLWMLAPLQAPLGMIESPNQAFMRITLAFGATVAGVLLGTAYRELRTLQARGVRRVKPKIFFANIWNSVELWLGLVGSPIVFAVLMRASEGVTLWGLAVMGLQNGFCCLVVVNALLGKIESAATSDHSSHPRTQSDGAQ